MVRNHLQTLTTGQSRKDDIIVPLLSPDDPVAKIYKSYLKRRRLMAEKENIEHVERHFGLINDECTDIIDYIAEWRRDGRDRSDLDYHTDLIKGCIGYLNDHLEDLENEIGKLSKSEL